MLKIEREDLHDKLSELKNAGYTYLVKITAVDYIDHLTALYMLRDIGKNKEEILEIDLNVSDLVLPTVTHIYKAADWYERELAEMFGISIKGRHARRLLLEKWNGTGAPLRKSFAWGQQYETADDAKREAKKE